MRNISTQCFCSRGGSTRDNPYIIVHFQCLPRKNYSFVSSLASSGSFLVSVFSSSLSSGGAGSDSLGGSDSNDNSMLDFWAFSKAFLKSFATVKHLVSCG